MLLLLDNYDSFVHNLGRYFERLGCETRVVRNDRIDVAAIRRLAPRAIVISPGPCTPREAGCTLDVIRTLHNEIPMLGVCLGHQALAEALGGRVIRAAEPVHGRASPIHHDGEGIFADLPNPFAACRYHSLVVDERSLGAKWRVTARTPDGVVMGLAHRQWPLFGVQFHPESILTEAGYPLLANFLRQAKMEPATATPTLADELAVPPQQDSDVPTLPITF